MDHLIRFLVGGLVVSIFAVIGDTFRPRSFSGIFGAAPTVALATLGLTFVNQGAEVVSREGRSMILGAVALSVQSALTSYLLLNRKWSSLPAALVALVVWLAVALALWALCFRTDAL